jgi:hypothetical protein
MPPAADDATVLDAQLEPDGRRNVEPGRAAPGEPQAYGSSLLRGRLEAARGCVRPTHRARDGHVDGDHRERARGEERLRGPQGGERRVSRWTLTHGAGRCPHDEQAGEIHPERRRRRWIQLPPAIDIGSEVSWAERSEERQRDGRLATRRTARELRQRTAPESAVGKQRIDVGAAARDGAVPPGGSALDAPYLLAQPRDDLMTLRSRRHALAASRRKDNCACVQVATRSSPV